MNVRPSPVRVTGVPFGVKAKASSGPASAQAHIPCAARKFMSSSRQSVLTSKSLAVHIQASKNFITHLQNT